MISQVQAPELDLITPPLQKLKASHDNATLNAYLRALVSARWPRVLLAEILSISPQAVSQRLTSARKSITEVDLTGLPVPSPPTPGRRYDVTTRTKSGLPLPDTAQITADAEQQTRAIITQFSGTPLQRLAALGDFVDEALARLDALRVEREELTWSLTCFERQNDLARAGGWERRAFHKRRLDVLGVSSERLKTMTGEELADLARARGIRHRADALPVYAHVAADIARAEAVVRVSEAARDALVADVVTRSEKTGRNENVVVAAEAIHRTPAAVWQILRRANR
jgi:hypothetical protein